MIDTKNITTEPGVYLFKDGFGTVVYVGKAKNLRKRVSSYFLGTQKLGKERTLVACIRDVETIIVDNEIEALLLENRLIKKHQPAYNIMLKDSKTFSYIKITDEKFPRILSTRRVTKKGKYFGPYVSGFQRKQLIQLIISIFKLRTCKLNQKRPCLNYHLKLCTGVCAGKIKEEEYERIVESVIRFLKGDTRDVKDRLKREMEDASLREEFEKAIEMKCQLEAVELVHNRQNVDLVKKYNQNIVAVKRIGKLAYIIVLSINKGVISGKKEYSFEYSETLLESFLKQYYPGRELPYEIVLSEGIDEEALIERYLSKLRGSRVKINVAKRGYKRKLVLLALKNIGGPNKALLELQLNLKLSDYPSVIECFDISNLRDEGIVAGMTRFVDGVSDSCRRFEIKSVNKQDDFAAMQEAVYRRYRRLAKEGGFPNLIIVDGGKGQLSSGLKALKMARVSIPIIALAKKEEEIYVPGLRFALKFDPNSQMMLLVRRMRDSVHRYSVSYQRKKREMVMREQFQS